MEKGSHSSLIKFYITKMILLFFVSSVYANCTEGQIDINTASTSDLQKLIGIGPTYAQRIIETRPFNSLDDLIKVKGIGNVTLQKIKNQGLACVSVQNESNGLIRTDNSQSLEERNSENFQQQITNADNQQKITNLQQKIDLNSAPVSSLIKIVGIGEKTAQEIINSRPFCSLDDLLKVKGIGQKNLQKIKEQGIAYVEENFCKNNKEEEKNSLNNLQNQQTERENKKTNNPQEDSKKESIINLNSNKEETKTNLATGKVVYESKTEKIRKYAIYLFAALLVVIVVLILKD